MILLSCIILPSLALTAHSETEFPQPILGPPLPPLATLVAPQPGYTRPFTYNYIGAGIGHVTPDGYDGLNHADISYFEVSYEFTDLLFIEGSISSTSLFDAQVLTVWEGVPPDEEEVEFEEDDIDFSADYMSIGVGIHYPVCASVDVYGVATYVNASATLNAEAEHDDDPRNSSIQGMALSAGLRWRVLYNFEVGVRYTENTDVLYNSGNEEIFEGNEIPGGRGVNANASGTSINALFNCTENLALDLRLSDFDNGAAFTGGLRWYF